MTKNIKISSNRSFGIVFFLFFLILFLWPLTKGQEVKIWLLIVSVIFLGLGLINSKLLTPLNKIWFKFGILLSKFTSPVILALIYYLTITPFAIVIRLFGKDLIKQKIVLSKKSYWIKRKDQVGSMKNQY